LIVRRKKGVSRSLESGFSSPSYDQDGWVRAQLPRTAVAIATDTCAGTTIAGSLVKQFRRALARNAASNPTLGHFAISHRGLRLAHAAPPDHPWATITHTQAPAGLSTK
jgi:hypothetical protein